MVEQNNVRGSKPTEEIKLNIAKIHESR